MQGCILNLMFYSNSSGYSFISSSYPKPSLAVAPYVFALKCVVRVTPLYIVLQSSVQGIYQ